MTATYGTRTQEGYQISIANVASLLGWDGSNNALNEARFNKMFALLKGSPADLNLEELERIGEEIVRLHTAFCQFYQLRPIEYRIHRIKLLYRLGRKFVKIARRGISQDFDARTLQPRGVVYGLHRSSLLMQSYIRLFLK